MTYAALCMAIAMVLPLITGQVPRFGEMLSPMHIPVLPCGFLCGPWWGLAVGLIAPPLRSVLFGMPPMFPTAVAMSGELAAYGALTGWLFRVRLGARAPRFVRVLAALLIAMIGGRAVWGLIQLALAGVQRTDFTMNIFLTRAVVDAIPGIILQLALIPPLVTALDVAGLTIRSKGEGS